MFVVMFVLFVFAILCLCLFSFFRSLTKAMCELCEERGGVERLHEMSMSVHVHTHLEEEKKEKFMR